MYRHFLYLFITSLFIATGFSMSVHAAPSKKFTVVLDAGHGGKDIGAADNGVMEKNINLQVAKQLEALIKKKLKNTSVVMTRDNDSYLTLQQRADKANKSKADLFISIHTNSVDKKNKNRQNIAGSSVYTLGLHKDENNLDVAMRENSVIELEQDYQQKYSGFDPQKDESYIIFEMAQKKNLSQSIRLAEDIEKELVNAGRKDRGVHQAGFWVLWATSMPSVLVELDFICNPESAKYMASEKGAKELAEAIFKAIQKYEAAWSKSQKNVADNKIEKYSDEASDISDVEYVSLASANVTKARKRSHNTGNISNTNTNADKKSGARKRRSAHSKELSLNKSFEQDNLKVESSRNFQVVAAADPDENVSVDKKEVATNKSRSKKSEKKVKEDRNTYSKDKNKRSHKANVNKLVTVYKIQLLASTDLLSENSDRFCGLKPISTFKENNLYKYFYGESTNKEKLEALLSDVRKKIPDAFIVESQKSIKK